MDQKVKKLSEVKTSSPILLQNNWLRGPRRIPKRKIDFYGVMNGVSIIWHLSGSFPILITGPIGFRKCQFSWLLMIYNVSLFICCSEVFIVALTHWDSVIGESVSITAITLVVQSVSALLSMMVICWSWWHYRKDFVDALDFLASQDVILTRLCCRVNYQIVDKIIKAYVYGTFLLICGLSIGDYFTSVHIYKEVSLSWIFWSMPKMMQVLATTIFVTLVILLANHFYGLNKRLKCIIERANAPDLKVVYSSDTIAENIRLVAKVHYNLCKIAKFFNRKFNGILVIMVATSFAILSSSFYFIFAEVQKEEKTDYYRVYIYVSWQLIHAIPIIITVIVCNWATNEATCTGKLIHEIRIVSTDSKLYEIVRSFSLQQHHQKIEFSGGRLFPLNSALLQTMIGHVTTSLVILIQFQPSIN